MEDPSPERTRLDALLAVGSGTRPKQTPVGFALPSGAFPIETHFEVLRRFMSLSRNGTITVEPRAVEQSGLPSGAAESNAAFLCELGLLIEEKPGWYKPTGVAMQLINTQLADDARGRRLLRSLIEKTWFGKSAKAMVGSQRSAPYQETELIATLAEVSKAPPGDDEAPLRVLLQYLEYTGILPPPTRLQGKEDEASHAVAPRVSSAPPASSSQGPTRKMPDTARGGPAKSPSRAGRWEFIQSADYSLRIRSNPAAFERLRKQLDTLEMKWSDTAKNA